MRRTSFPVTVTSPKIWQLRMETPLESTVRLPCTLQKAAEELGALIDKTLTSDNHKWYLNEMDPEEKARREEAVKEFQKRYAK